MRVIKVSFVIFMRQLLESTKDGAGCQWASEEGRGLEIEFCHQWPVI